MAENFVNDTEDGSEQFEIERIAGAGCPNLGPSFRETGGTPDPEPAAEDSAPVQFEIERMAGEGCPNLGPFFWETGDAAEPDPDEAE